MSGRVKTLQAALASVLNVKPIAVLLQGDLTMKERVRTRKASLDRVIEMAKDLGISMPRSATDGVTLIEAIGAILV